MQYFSNRHSAALAAALITLFSAKLFASGGLILPMPGQKQMDKASATIKIPEKKPETKKAGNTGAIIPLPGQIKRVPVKKAPEPVAQPVTPKDNPVLPISLPPKPELQPSLADDVPVPPDEVVISPNDSLNDLLPPAPPPEAPGAGGSGSLPVFPKDTSSAIFMVMKSWQCDSYDGNTLLAHALEVYSKEADDAFKIEGLNASEEFLITVEEEDITLDELLDILAMKSGRDWGVDIPSKVIYFYPKGVSADAYNVW